MALAKEAKTDTIGQYRTHATDTGSPEVQVALLTRQRDSVGAGTRALVEIVETELKLGICLREFVKDYFAAMNPRVGVQVEPPRDGIQSY